MSTHFVLLLLSRACRAFDDDRLPRHARLLPGEQLLLNAYDTLAAEHQGAGGRVAHPQLTTFFANVTDL